MVFHNRRINWSNFFTGATARWGPSTAGITSTFSQTEMKNNPARLGVTCDHHVNSPAVVGFLNRDYFYKLVVILKMLGWYGSYKMAIKSSPNSDCTSAAYLMTSSMHLSSNRVTTGPGLGLLLRCFPLHVSTYYHVCIIKTPDQMYCLHNPRRN